jgi:CDP-glucose 4,6-dehydratase
MKNNFFKDKKVLVTGHTGFKGAWLSFYLYLLGSKVMGISLKPSTKPSLFEILGLKNIIDNNFINILEEKKIEKKILQFKPDIIFHLAAQAIIKNSYNDPLNTWKTNLIGSINILEAIRKLKKKCTCVMITSDKCYENLEKITGYKEDDVLGGTDPDSASKASTEIAIKSYFKSFMKDTNHRIATARAGNVIGGGDWSPNRIIPDCIKSIAEGKKVKIRNANATRPWQHVIEILNGYLKLAKKLYSNQNINGQSFNFGPKNSEIVPVSDILEYINDIWPGFRWVKTKNIIKNETDMLVLNTKKAKKKLNWNTRLNVKQATNLTIEWYKEFYKSKKNNLIIQLTKDQILQYHRKFKL